MGEGGSDFRGCNEQAAYRKPCATNKQQNAVSTWPLCTPLWEGCLLHSTEKACRCRSAASRAHVLSLREPNATQSAYSPGKKITCHESKATKRMKPTAWHHASWSNRCPQAPNGWVRWLTPMSQNFLGPMASYFLFSDFLQGKGLIDVVRRAMGYTCASSALARAWQLRPQRQAPFEEGQRQLAEESESEDPREEDAAMSPPHESSVEGGSRSHRVLRQSKAKPNRVHRPCKFIWSAVLTVREHYTTNRTIRRTVSWSTRRKVPQVQRIHCLSLIHI